MANVLIVASSKHVQEICRRNLNNAGHTVALAFNGVEAETLHSPNDFDLVIAEHKMPLMSGMELLSRLRNDLPAVILAADDSDHTDYIDHPQVKRCLTKPFNPSILVTLVTELLL